MMNGRALFVLLTLLLCLSACDNGIWNSPQPEERYAQNVRYGSFAASPKTLDPAASYSLDEALLVAQIYEPPLQYDYLKRPYTLVPLTAVRMPEVRYWDRYGQQLSEQAPADTVASTTYDITIKPNIFYQPHPAFARSPQGQYLYHALSRQALHSISVLSDFAEQGTRELVAEDYVYQIKRLAHPNVTSPILDLMSYHIIGLSDYARELRKLYDTQKNKHTFFDLRQYPLVGAQVIDKYTYRITLQGKYQQFLYWLTMSFFAPIPWEADAFYSQSGMKEKNLSFNWQPVGTGAYYLLQNNPNKEMVLQKNPNFHAEYFPTEGMPGDAEAGYLQNAGKRLPFVDQYVFSLEKEVIPRWNKFLQGYYDQSSISSDTYGEAIQLDRNGEPALTEFLTKKDIRLQTRVDLSIAYFGINMLDETVGGYSERARKLRQAIKMVLDLSEYSAIFLNGRGVPSRGPIPPGIFGYAPPHANFFKQKSLDTVRSLLTEAGYPEGINPKTGKPLIIRFDSTMTSPGDQNRFMWIRNQLGKVGVDLDVEITDANRFQEKMRTGDVQFFMYGWSADYPDPENFLFLFYGPNGQVKYGGMNAANYANEQYDSLFRQMQHMPNDEARFQIIQEMIDILQQDAPWVGEMYTKTLMLSHRWLGPYKPSAVQNNVLKYQEVDPAMRMAMIQQWNRPMLWPLGLIVLVILLVILPAVVGYYRRMNQIIKR